MNKLNMLIRELEKHSESLSKIERILIYIALGLSVVMLASVTLLLTN